MRNTLCVNNSRSQEVAKRTARADGFTLMELMIVIAIIGILAAVAVPQYGRYTQRAKYAEVVTQTTSYKTAVSLCAQETGALTTCTPGSFPGIPPNLGQQGSLQSLTTLQGVISAVGTADVNDRTYILTPAVTPGAVVTWTVSGSCITAGYCPEH